MGFVFAALLLGVPLALAIWDRAQLGRTAGARGAIAPTSPQLQPEDLGTQTSQGRLGDA